MGNNLKLDVLAIAAHPDDIEITCGGLMIKMAKKGRKTGALELTQGETGTFGDEKIRAKELKKAASIMGLSYRENLKMPDAAVTYNQDNKLRIAEVIRHTRPELVILPHWEQRHPDHLACMRLGWDACYLAGLKKLNLSGEPFRPRKIIYASYYRNKDFSFIVDVSDEYNQKIKAIKAHHSQFSHPERAKKIFVQSIDFMEMVTIRMKYLGQLAGVRYAEAYSIKETFMVDDPQKMPIQSI